VNYTSPSSSIFAGIIAGSGKTLTLHNPLATLTLTGANSYTGGTTITSGTLQIGNNGTTGNLGSGNVVDNGTLAVSRSNTITISNDISGSGVFNQIGSGTTILSGNNSYTGGTNINNGILNLGSANAIGTTGTISFGGGALQYSASNQTDYSSRFSNAANQDYKIDTNGQNVAFATGLTSSGGTFTKSGTGTLVLNAVNSYTGATTVNAGTLAAGATHALGSTSSVTVASGATLALSGAGGNDRINDSAAINLNGGATFNSGGLTEGVVPTGPTGSGGSAGMGALTLAATSPASHIVINFAAPGSALAFSSLVGAAGQYVDIFNWTGNIGYDDGNANNDRLLSASDPGLSQTDLANFNFYSDGGSTLITAGGTEFGYGDMFEIVAVPEPGTWFAAVLALAAIGFSQRKRLRVCPSSAVEKNS